MTIDIHQLSADEVWDHGGGERLRSQFMRRAPSGVKWDSGDRRYVRIFPVLITAGGESELGKAADGAFAELASPGLPILSYFPLELGEARQIKILRGFSHGANLPF